MIQDELNRSSALVLDTFYLNLKTVGVSSVTGLGMNKFLMEVEDTRQGYLDVHIQEQSAFSQSTKEAVSKMSDLCLRKGAIMEEDADEDEKERGGMK